MKQMIAVSLGIHLTVGMLVVLLAWFGERRNVGSIYTVNLITPVTENKRTAPEPPKEKRPKIAEPLKMPTTPPQKAAKQQKDRLTEKIASLSRQMEADSQPARPAPRPKPKQEVADLKPVPLLKPSQPSAEPGPTVPAPVPGRPSQQSPPPAPSDEAALTKSVAKAVMDVPHFNFPLYGALIEKRINALWSPPPLIVGLEGKEAIVSFQLGRSGHIQEVQIEESSGNFYYDQAALRAIQEANPLPPWPQGFHEPSLKVYIRFELSKEG